MPIKGARKSSSKKAPGRPLKVPLKESFIHGQDEDISVDDEERCPQDDEEQSGPQDEEPSQLSGATEVPPPRFFRHHQEGPQL